ncbi:MAG: isoprenylcysteine carboxylmethyltransferase family protein [Acidobacteriota bacterium]|nr:MAG: isoprenylcysteine carboxylmethyltransferase family protein [Acidobacteriota bacterium]
MTKRIAFFAYGAACYIMFLGTFLYAIGWVGNLFVPTRLDGPRTASFGFALLIDLGLLTLFAVQHSGMARQGFKRVWTRIVPNEIERSTYVLFTNIALILMFALWQPLGGAVWNVEDPVGQTVLYALFAFGWGLVLVSTFLLDHFSLFGLRQVWAQLIGCKTPAASFVTPGPYRMVRHPLYLGFLLAFWATPTMTVAHLVFAVMTTGYILVAIQLEERDLIAEYGERYREYRRRVPMLIPSLGRSSAGSRISDAA